jgi:hypothetical protein
MSNASCAVLVHARIPQHVVTTHPLAATTIGGRHHTVKLLAWHERAELASFADNKPGMLVFECATPPPPPPLGKAVPFPSHPLTTNHSQRAHASTTQGHKEAGPTTPHDVVIYMKHLMQVPPSITPPCSLLLHVFRDASWGLDVSYMPGLMDMGGGRRWSTATRWASSMAM